jgi:hypothetical protein
MEDYESFRNSAKIHTEVHARPNQEQKLLMAELAKTE